MAPDKLEAVRSRYMAAYDAYVHAAKRVADKLAAGLFPSEWEVEAEAKASERLAAARRELQDAIAFLGSSRD
jgi:hypothetical protein